MSLKQPGKEIRSGRSYWLIASLLVALFALLTVIAGFALTGVQAGAGHPEDKPGFDFSNYGSKPDPADVFPAGLADDRLYNRRIPLEYPDGTQINITERSGAEDTNYGRLVSLLRDDPSEHGVYEENAVCSHFAVRLHNSAENCGIDAHIVLIDFEDGGIPHVIVGFNTTDRGMIYVDDTGLTPEQKAAGLLDRDRIVDLVPGQPYHASFLPPYDEVNDRLSLGVVEKVIFIT